MASTRTQRRRQAGKFFIRLEGSSRPFVRAQALFQKIVDRFASMASALPIDRQLAMDVIPPYVSRGHGGRHRPMQRLVDGRAMQDRSKYSPIDERPSRKSSRMMRPLPPSYDLAALCTYVDRIRARTIAVATA